MSQIYGGGGFADASFLEFFYYTILSKSTIFTPAVYDAHYLYHVLLFRMSLLTLVRINNINNRIRHHINIFDPALPGF